MPDLHKTAKRRKLRLRLEPYRPRRKRLTMQALYDAEGTPVVDEASIGDLIARVWEPVFARREVDQEHMQHFLSFVPSDAGRTAWTWPRGQVATVASRMPSSAPGPDGLPYSFWANAGPSAEDFVDDVAERATRGESIPAAMLASHTVFPPKGEYHDDTAQVMRRATELRPLTLMRTSFKMIATIANQELTLIADKVVAGNQRGFIPHRVMSDNILQFEGAAFAYSQLWGGHASRHTTRLRAGFPLSCTSMDVGSDLCSRGVR